jgi:hypothetical protein
MDRDIYWKDEFPWLVANEFQALRAFCDLINQTISNRLIEFNSNQYATAFVVPQTLFESETKSLMNQFRSSLASSFLLFLAMIRDTTQANALFSAVQSNYYMFAVRSEFDRVRTSPKTYDNCSCSSSFTCISESFIDHSGSSFNMPGFYTGCYVIEALLQSTLKCLYDQMCINELQRRIAPLSKVDATALNKSLPTVYFMNSTIKEVVNNLMIEEWNDSSIFENYYNQCQPIKCTYTLQTNNDIIYIVTELLRIVGGLTTALKFIIPFLVKFIRKKKQQQQRATGKFKTKTSYRVLIRDCYPLKTKYVCTSGCRLAVFEKR